MYEPLKIFMVASVPFFVVGLRGIIRFFWYYLQGMGDGMIQSLVLASLLMMVAINFFSLGVL